MFEISMIAIRQLVINFECQKWIMIKWSSKMIEILLIFFKKMISELISGFPSTNTWWRCSCTGATVPAGRPGDGWWGRHYEGKPACCLQAVCALDVWTVGSGQQGCHPVVLCLADQGQVSWSLGTIHGVSAQQTILIKGLLVKITSCCEETFPHCYTYTLEKPLSL